MTVRPAASPVDQHETLCTAPTGDLQVPEPADSVAVTARRLMLRHGYNSNDILALYRGWRYFISKAPDGVVMYQERAGTYVACGDPICASGDLAVVLARFASFTAHRRRRCAFLGASERLAVVAAAHRFGVLKVGEEPFFDLAAYAPRGDRAKKVRAAVNQARRLGVQVSTYRRAAAPNERLEREALRLCAAWQATRPAGELGFGLKLEPFTGADAKRYFVADAGERMVGLLACSPMPARNGWYLEDVIRDPHAPNGTTELLVTTALEALREEGASLASLGVAPLAGVEHQPGGGQRLPAAMLAFTRERLNHCYHFKSLGRYKRKYAPSFWEGSYLLYRPGRITPPLLWSLLTVFLPESPTAMLAAGLRRRLRRPPAIRRPRLQAHRPAARVGVMLGVCLLALAASHTPAGERSLPLLHLHLWLALLLVAGGAALRRGVRVQDAAG